MKNVFVLLGIAAVVILTVKAIEDPDAKNLERLGLAGAGLVTGLGPEIALGEGLISFTKKPR